MGDILDLIKTRRNVKNFLPKYVSYENIMRVLDAARYAPSSGNIQNWKFIIVLDIEKKEKLAEACYDQYEITAAGALIVVCAEVEKAERYYGLRGERLYSIQNCAAAIQNMLLEAHSLGLATCWIGAFDEDAIKSILNIPEEVRPQAIIPLGYAKEVPQAPPKYALEHVVYLESWRGTIRDLAKYLRDYATILGRKAQSAKSSLHKGVKSVVDKAKDLSQNTEEELEY